VLVTGFGPFLSVLDNPAAQLARAVHDPDGDPPIHGLVIPVSYERGPEEAVQAARRLGVRLVIGLGVATGREHVCVERVGRLGLDPSAPDVDEDHRDRVDGDEEAPQEVLASIPVEAFAEAMGAQVSDDAGRYVCNAWLYHVARALPDLPVGFVHVPAAGMDLERLRAGIAALLARAPLLG
jgi:pyroglutamyl-peptidase